MNAALVLFEYITWHFWEGIQEYIRAWRNLHWFLYRFFSMSVLIATLFQPFHRIQEPYKRTFDLEVILEAFLGNIMTRVVGFFVRAVLLLTALLAHMLLFVSGAAVLALFLVSPVLIPFIFMLSYLLMFP